MPGAWGLLGSRIAHILVDSRLAVIVLRADESVKEIESHALHVCKMYEMSLS